MQRTWSVLLPVLIHVRYISKMRYMQEVKDVSGGCGSSFEVLVVSSQFEGKPLLQRHR